MSSIQQQLSLNSVKRIPPFPGHEFPYLHGSLCYIMYNPEDKQTEKVVPQPTEFLNSVHDPAAQRAAPAQGWGHRHRFSHRTATGHSGMLPAGNSGRSPRQAAAHPTACTPRWGTQTCTTTLLLLSIPYKHAGRLPVHKPPSL